MISLLRRFTILSLTTLVVWCFSYSLGVLHRPINDSEISQYASLKKIKKLSHNDLDADETQIKCLATNLYYEARGSSEKEQIAVAFVTLNRRESGEYPDNVCHVVYQGKRISDGRFIGQFSWTHEGHDVKKINVKTWKEMYRVAKTVYDNYEVLPDPTNGATHYYSHKILKHNPPHWAVHGKDKIKLTDHIYMKL